MFNSGAKKEAERRLNFEKEKFDSNRNETLKVVEANHKQKEISCNIIKNVERFINNIANKPKEFDKTLREIKINIKKFDNDLIKIKNEFKNVETKGYTTMASGAVVGGAVVGFGPSAAMAIATTFGTASTGTAISALSGAAATNAALAWLGGGALAAGGGGMALGNTFLALTGPVGWALGGAIALGGGAYMNSKNKEAARKYEKAICEIKKEDTKLKKLKKEVNELLNTIKTVENTTTKIYTMLIYRGINDYLTTSSMEKELLIELKNSTESLSKLINKTLKMENN